MPMRIYFDLLGLRKILQRDSKSIKRSGEDLVIKDSEDKKLPVGIFRCSSIYGLRIFVDEEVALPYVPVTRFETLIAPQILKLCVGKDVDGLNIFSHITIDDSWQAAVPNSCRITGLKHRWLTAKDHTKGSRKDSFTAVLNRRGETISLELASPYDPITTRELYQLIRRWKRGEWSTAFEAEYRQN